MPERVRGSLEWDTYADAFGVRLREIREHRGLTQLELSLKAGVSHNTVSNAERGVSNHPPHIADPGLSMIYRLAKALNVPPMHLMPDVDQPLQPICSEKGDRSRVEQRIAEVIERLSDGDPDAD